MIEYKISNDNICLINSAFVSKKDFKYILEKIREENPENQVIKNRNNLGMILEWAVHNFLYKLNYQPKRTINCDLEYPQNWYYKLGYSFFGPLCWILIK